MKRFMLLSIIISILCVSIAYPESSSEYFNYGKDQYFLDDTDENDADFTSSFAEDAIVFQRPITGSQGLPLVGDIDSDGDVEIVVIQSSGFAIFRHDVQGGFYAVGGIGQAWTGFVSASALGNIDADEFIEIVITDNDYIRVFHFDGTTITKEYENNFCSGNNCDYMLRCEESLCFYVETPLPTFNTASKTIRVGTFDRYGMKAVYTPFGALTDGTHNTATCLPDNKHIAYDDIDNDGDYEFAYNFVWSQNNDPDVMIIGTHRFNSSGAMVENVYSQAYTPEFDFNFGGTCFSPSNVGRYFTSLNVGDYNYATQGLEYVIAYQDAIDEFHMVLREFMTNTYIETYPEDIPLSAGNGQLISNVFRAYAFPDTNGHDFCAFGYNAEDDHIGLICGSRLTSEFCDTREFFQSNYNYTLGQLHTDFSKTAHAIQFDDDIIRDDTGNFNPSEFLSSYGVIEITEYPSSSCNNGELNISYNFVNGDKTLIAGDYDGEGYFDIVGITQSNVYYADNDFTNRPAYIVQAYIDPYCDGELWDDSTTLLVEPIIGDPERDQVRAKVVLYSDKNYSRYASGYEDDGWSDYSTPNQDITFFFDSVLPDTTDHLSEHNFNSNSDSGGSGWTNSWSGTGYTYSAVAPYEGGFSLMVDDTDKAYRNFSLTHDIDAYESLNLTIWGKGAPIAGAETCTFAYHNGSAYVTLLTISTANGNNDGTWRRFSFDLVDTGISTDMRVRASKTAGGSDCFFDLLSISYNETIGSLFNQKMTIYYNDQSNPNIIGEETKYFSVIADGVMRGTGCDTTFSYDEPTEEPDGDDPSVLDKEKNAIVSTLDELDALGFAYMGRTLKYFIFIAIVITSMIYFGFKEGYKGSVIVVLCGMFSILAFVIGAMLGVISPALIMIVGILAVGLVVIVIKMAFMRSN